MANVCLKFKLRVALVIMKYKQGVTIFAAVSDAPACCIHLTGGANFISRPLQKFLSDVSVVL